MVTDNGFTSLSLAKSLLNKSITLCGTLRSNRIEIPRILLKSTKKEIERSISLFYKPEND